jgi:hypothetical protein
MKPLFLTAALVAFTAAAAGAQGLHGGAMPGEVPGSGQGGSSTAALQVRIRVVAANGVAFTWAQGVRSGGMKVQGGPVAVEDTQAGDLAIEVWKAVDGAMAGGRGERVAAGPVRLQSDATGRARGEVGPAVAGALRAAAAQPGVYTVAVAY